MTSKASPSRPPAKLVIFLALIIIIGGIGYLILTGDYGTGYKVIIKGSVTFTQGQGITLNHYSVQDISRDTKLLNIQQLWLFNPDDIHVIVTLQQAGIEQYRSWVGLGAFSWITETKPFTLVVRHAEPGAYIGMIELWEIHYGPGPLPILEEYREQVMVSEEFNIAIP